MDAKFEQSQTPLKYGANPGARTLHGSASFTGIISVA